MTFQASNNVAGVVSNGNQLSVDMASQALERTMNQNSVKQMQLMEQQANQQLMQTQIKHRADVMNSAKEHASSIRL
jgi:hypothetical protein